MISSALVHAKTYDSDYGDEIKKDRQRLFYRICVDAYKDVPKRGASLLCPTYARKIEGNDFHSIFDSMQSQFRDMARRNSHLPRVILTEKKTKKEFLNLLEEQENKDPKYVEFLFPGDSDTTRTAPPAPSRRVPRIIDVNVIDLSENDMNTGIAYIADQNINTNTNTNERTHNNVTARGEDSSVDLNTRNIAPQAPIKDVVESRTDDEIEQIKQPVASSSSDNSASSNTVQADDLSSVANTNAANNSNKYTDEEVRQIYNESLEIGLTKYCVSIIKQNNGKATQKDVLYCDKFAKNQKDKSIEDIIQAFKNDPALKADVREAVLKKLITTIAIREGYDEKQIGEFVYSGGHVKVADVANTPTVDEIKPSDSQSRGPAVVNMAPDDVEDTLRDAYARILQSEIAKNCSSTDTKCIEDISRKINEQRDAALANLKPTPIKIDEVSEIKEPQAVEEIKIPAVKPVVSEANCEDQIQNRIRELLEKDDNNILGKQFQLTSLKMALQIMETRSKKRLDNVEEYIRVDQKKLLDRDNKQVIDSLVNFYRDHGKVEDENFIDKTFNKVAGSNYFRSSTRIYNDSASVMILADSLTNENSRFSEVDAASVWFASEINKNFRQGSYHNNLTNLSSLTFRVLGKLKNEKPPIDINKLKSGISQIEKDLSGNYEIMRKEIGEKFADCFQGEFASCNAKPAFDKNFARSLMDLTSKIKNNENYSLEIDRSLKGAINEEFKFDFLPGQYK